MKARVVLALESIRSTLDDSELRLVDSLFPPKIFSPGHQLTAVVPPLGYPDTRSELREWWHHVLRSHGQYSCYAIFLVLPSDEEAISYLVEYRDELDVISNRNCLVIASRNMTVRRSLSKDAWNVAIRDSTSKGYNAEIAHLFDIDFTQFPCLLLFQDIRFPRCSVIALKGLNAEQISQNMRLTFSIIGTALSKDIDPIDATDWRYKREDLRKTGKSLVCKSYNFAGKAFEKAVEVLIKTTIESIK